MFNVSLADLLDYTDWERQKRYEWMRQQGDQVLKVSAGANGDRFETVGDLVKHIFSAEKRYVERLAGRPMTDTTSVLNDNVEALFQFGWESRKSLKEFVESFPTEKWDVAGTEPRSCRNCGHAAEVGDARLAARDAALGADWGDAAHGRIQGRF